jgi:hypothetical protein
MFGFGCSRRNQQKQGMTTSEKVRAAENTSEAVVPLGVEFIRQMKDCDTEPDDLMRTVQTAIVEKKMEHILAARDERGRSPLHVAATRGDLRICKKIMEADPGILNVRDQNGNTPLMDAAFSGRCLIVKEMIKNGVDVSSKTKNRDCMNALQLAVVNEGAGNGEVVEDLVKAGADLSHNCWQVTPLMAAADSGHFWALQTLIDHGADPWQTNGSGFTALDYARDMETSQFLYDLMQGNQIANSAAPRFDTQKLFKDADERRKRLHIAARSVSLEDAFATLEADSTWLSEFRETGEHYNDLRKLWRKIIMKCHPDKQPEDLEDEEAAEWTAQFQRAAMAFEAIEKHYRTVAPDDDQPSEVQEPEQQ